LGKVLDQTKCIGCHACITARQSENGQGGHGRPRLRRGTGQPGRAREPRPTCSRTSPPGSGAASW